MIAGLGRYPGERKGYPLQYSGLVNSMDCLVHEFAKSWPQLSDFHISFVLIIYPGSSLEKVSPFLWTAAFNNQAAFLLSRRKVREVESVSVCHCKLQLI